MSSDVKKSTFKAILIMMFSMFMSRGIGFIRTGALAYEAGTGTGADAYAFAFLLPDLLNQIMAGGALSVTFIPLFQSLDNNRDAQNRFFSNLFWIGTVVFIIAITGTWIWTPDLLRYAAGANIPQGEVFDLTVKLTRIILPAQLFFFWGALLNGVQYANRQFFIPSLTAVIYNIGIIIGGLALTPFIGIDGFAWGVLVGAFVGNVVVQIPGVRKCGVSLNLHIDHKDKMLHEWFIKTVPLIFTMGLAFSNEFMSRIFGSRSPEGTGALSALNYSYRLFMIFVGMFGQAFAAGIYPFISKLANDKNLAEMEKMLFGVLEKSAALTLTASALLFAVRYDLVSLLYGYGKFDASSTKITADALAAYLPGMFFFSGVLLMNRLFFALRQTYTTLIISLITLALTIPVYSTIGLKLGVIGIGLTGSLASLITFALLLIRWKQIHRESRMIPFVLSSIHITLVSIVIGAMAYGMIFVPLPADQTILWKAVRICVQTIPPFILGMIYFDRTKILPIKSLLRRKKQ